MVLQLKSFSFQPLWWLLLYGCFLEHREVHFYLSTAWAVCPVSPYMCLRLHLIKSFFLSKEKKKPQKLIEYFNSNKIPINKKKTKALCHYTPFLLPSRMFLPATLWLFFSAELFFVSAHPPLLISACLHMFWRPLIVPRTTCTPADNYGH